MVFHAKGIKFYREFFRRINIWAKQDAKDGQHPLLSKKQIESDLGEIERFIQHMVNVQSHLREEDNELDKVKDFLVKHPDAMAKIGNEDRLHQEIAALKKITGLTIGHATTISEILKHYARLSESDEGKQKILEQFTRRPERERKRLIDETSIEQGIIGRLGLARSVLQRLGNAVLQVEDKLEGHLEYLKGEVKIEEGIRNNMKSWIEYARKESR